MKTTKKPITTLPSTEQLLRLGTVASELRTSVPELVILNNEEKRAAPNMASGSDAPCRQLLDFMGANPHMVPPGVDLAYAQSALAAVEALRRSIPSIDVLSRYAHDTEHALGAYIRAAAMEGYALLKRSGPAHGHHELLRTLSAQFAKGKAKRSAKATPAAAGTGTEVVSG